MFQLMMNFTIMLIFELLFVIFEILYNSNSLICYPVMIYGNILNAYKHFIIGETSSKYEKVINSHGLSL